MSICWGHEIPSTIALCDRLIISDTVQDIEDPGDQYRADPDDPKIQKDFCLTVCRKKIFPMWVKEMKKQFGMAMDKDLSGPELRKVRKDLEALFSKYSSEKLANLGNESLD